MSVAARSAQRSSYAGRTASSGLALGPIVVDAPRLVAARAAGDPQAEHAALVQALDRAAADIATLMEQNSGEAAEMLEFQLALVADDALSAPAFAAIGSGTPAHVAWAGALEAQIADYAAADDEYFRARAADLADLSDRVARILAGAGEAAALPPGAIFLGHDISPTYFLGMDWNGRGIALTGGSATSHVAMLARARGVPMLVGLGPVDAVSGETALLDAGAGRFVVAPDGAERTRFAADLARLRDQAALDADRARATAMTSGGERVQVLINVADPAELDTVDPGICDGIGLARTELMFHGPGGLPGEDEQLAAYRRLLAWAGPRPVTVRTLDAGGDKPIPGYTLDNEQNSFLGLRGVRLSLSRPQVFAVQVRALLRAAVDGDLRVMVPMVSVAGEMDRVAAIFREEEARLAAAGIAHRMPALGMMVEVPAAALTLDLFDIDFASIGSNDLVQYVMAASRDSADVADLADPAGPAVRHILSIIVAKARSRDIPLSLCGDAGGDPAVVPMLLDIGLRSLSVAPAAVGRVKAAIAAHGS